MCIIPLATIRRNSKQLAFCRAICMAVLRAAFRQVKFTLPAGRTIVKGVKALAIAAYKCFENYRPGGVRVHGGSVILEPTLRPEDFAELRKEGVWLAKAGFGSVNTPFDYVPLVQAAREAGFIVNVHTGGASISLANSINGEHLLAMRPNVSFHVNGGPIAMPDQDFERVIKESDIALQICQAGNIRTAISVRESRNRKRRV